MAKIKRTKGQIMIHGKLKIGQHEPTENGGKGGGVTVNSGAAEG